MRGVNILNNKIGIGSWTFPWAIGVDGYPYPKEPLNVFDLLERARLLGVDVVQYCDNMPLNKLKEDELINLKTKSKDYGLDIEVGTRGIEPDHLLKYIKIAKKLDSKFIRTIIDCSKYNSSSDKPLNLLKQIVPYLEKENIYLGIENHENCFAKELGYLVENLGSKYVGICLDTVNSFGTLETPKQVVDTLSPYVINLHFKDFKIERVDHQMGLVINGCPAGEGELDISWLLDNVIQNRENMNIILEQWPPFNETIEKTITMENKWAENGIKFLENFLYKK